MVYITTNPSSCYRKSAAYFNSTTVFVSVLLLIFQTPSYAVELEVEKVPVWYRNADERRHGALGVEVADWLRVTGTLEVEKRHQVIRFSNGEEEGENEPVTQAVQVGINASLNDYVYAELVWDAEFDPHLQTHFDESIIGIAINRWDLTMGRQYVPFGQYYTRFVIDPLLQFGETNGDALVIEYGMSHELDITAFGFQPGYQQGGRPKREFGMAFEYHPEHLMLEMGVSYIAQLINTDALTQDENGQASWRDAEGLGVYLSTTVQSIELSAESIVSRNVYNSDNVEINPYAFNFELSYFVLPRLLLAVRYEYGDGLDSLSTHRYGIAASWHPFPHVRLDVNYLYSRYRNQTILEEEEDTPDTGYQTAAQIAFEF